MGQDNRVSGSNFNAKMTYTSGGVVGGEALNDLGKALNLFSGNKGVNVNTGYNGGIEVKNTGLFPWRETSFGYTIGSVDDNGVHDPTEVKKITITNGTLWIGQGAEIEMFMVPTTVLDLVGAMRDNKFDIIYLKHLNNVEDETQDEIIVHTVDISNATLLQPTKEIEYIPLYAFWLNGSAVQYSELLAVFNIGDIWLDAGFPWGKISFGYRIGVGTDFTKVTICGGNVWINNGEGQFEFQVAHKTLTLTANTTVYLKHNKEGKTEIVTDTGATFLKDTSTLFYVPLYKFEYKTIGSTSGAVLEQIYHMGDVYITYPIIPEISFGYTIGVLDAGAVSPNKVSITGGYLYCGQGEYFDKVFLTGEDFTITGVSYIYVKYTYATKALEFSKSSNLQNSTDLIYYRLLHTFNLHTLTYDSGGSQSTAVIGNTYHLGDIFIPLLEKAKVYTDITWDTDTHQIKADIKTYYMMPISDAEAAEEIILTAELCP